jgi:hypothetical protein
MLVDSSGGGGSGGGGGDGCCGGGGGGGVGGWKQGEGMISPKILTYKNSYLSDEGGSDGEGDSSDEDEDEFGRLTHTLNAALMPSCAAFTPSCTTLIHHTLAHTTNAQPFA